MSRKTGKEKCEMLRRIRQGVARQYGLEYTPHECTHEGDCPGTCPMCDAELRDLQRQLREKDVSEILVKGLTEEEHILNNIDMDPSLDMTDAERRELGLMPDLPAGVPAVLDDDEVLEGDPIPLEGEVMPPNEDLSHVHLVYPQKRKLLKTCYVAGLQFHDAVDLALEMNKGQRLFLIREPHNEHDSNAVAVAFADEYDENTVIPDEFSVIGYIPRSSNADTATMLDMGWANILECEVSEVNASGSWNHRLEVAIYIKSNKSTESIETGLRVMTVSDAEYRDIHHSLMMKGYVYFRWMTLPTMDHNLPHTGERVLVLHKNRTRHDLIYMAVVATGDAAAQYVNPDELHMIDDCSPFILTNVIGPVKVSRNAFKIFKDEPIDSGQPESRLSPEATDKVLSLLADQWR